jgi:hypothetical protein
VRPISGSGTLWRVRIPRDASPRTTRLVVVASRAGQADEYASRLSLGR